MSDHDLDSFLDAADELASWIGVHNARLECNQTVTHDEPEVEVLP